MKRDYYKQLENYAFFLLGRREYSLRDLSKKCSEYIDKKQLKLNQTDIDRLLHYLVEENYQSDDRMALSLFKSYYESGRGMNYIKSKFFEKGLKFNMDFIEENVEFDFFESCKDYFDRKYSTLDINDLDFKEKGKIIRHMMSRGFQMDEINYAFSVD